MERAELAARLVEADDAARAVLLRDNSALADTELAYALKDICWDSWTWQPARATGAAAGLEALSRVTEDEEIAALAAWVAGIAEIVNGQMERAIAHLDEAEARFHSLGKSHTSAATQNSKLYALALLGRYDQAIECGLRARELFLAHGDSLAAGKIEVNIGNIYFRRDRYREAEQFQSAARERFTALHDESLLAVINNCLANTHSSLHKFRSAEDLYKEALSSAESAGLSVTQAEIEGNMGNLALLQGRYDRALDFLERSRRKYTALGMPHQSAIAEMEIADAYLELNLAPEAAAIYERVIPTFSELGMRAEQARALANYGRVSVVMGQISRALGLLGEAEKLYADERNSVGAALVRLTLAQLYYKQKNFALSGRLAEEAEAPFQAAGTWRRLLMARWLRGESLRAEGRLEDARSILLATFHDAEVQAQPQVAQHCHTSLGLLSEATGDRRCAEASFKRAVELIEDLRAPLPAEEFRTAFFADKLVPYDELVRLCLSDKSRDRSAEALGFVERARSRALVEMLGGSLRVRVQPRDTFEAGLVAQLEELREELNWFYSRINRSSQAEASRGSIEMDGLHEEIRERETKTLEITRQLQHSGDGTLTQTEAFDTGKLQSDLGKETALVEYTCLDGELLAFVLTNEGVEVVRNLCREEEATAALEQFRFQIDALRYGAARMRKHLTNLRERVLHHLQTLYDLLLRPVEERIGERRLAFVPHRALHYVPFHALHDGASYLIERREVSYAPSAIVLHHCLSKPQGEISRALLLGVADEQTPRVIDEIETLAPLFPESLALLNGEATLAALREHAPEANILHLACHGQFRPDNPLFSSLRLGDGWLTVRDAYKLNLHCEMVTLSACETGVSAVAPGDELMGLARGFFSAGVPTLLLSLWTVDDEATARLMASFYTKLRAGNAPAAALRQAQLDLMKEEAHPYFWSPFVLLGRW
ncbi:MAG: CHAT domain-containing tetratricopeptide repeat protein [Pyrinomonadaceae bacterium]